MSTPVSQPLDPHAIAFEGVQLIEASAGTGKTWNITLLHARAVLEAGLPVGRILVVTFTRAAAAELRERIRRRLADLLEACERPAAADAVAQRLLDDAAARSGQDRPALATRLRLALGEFDQAAIHTIHGFCQRALADAPLVAGAPLDGELLADDGEIACAVMRDVWRRRMASDPPGPALAAALLAAGEGPDQLARALQLHQGKPLAEVRWPGQVEQADSVLAAAQPAVLAAWEALAPLWRAECVEVERQLRECMHGFDRRSYSETAVERALAQWQALVAADQPLAALDRHDKLRLLRASVAVPSGAGRRAGVVSPVHPFFALAEQFLAAREAFDRTVKLARAALLRELLEAALPELAARKRAAGQQAYDDLLTALYRSLCGPHGAALAENLRQRYPLALVDEFQDTDPVQLAILRTVYRSGTAALLMVGDPKQAIYAFRNADLHSYLEARAGADRVWTLDHNQRADPALITASNALFGRNPRPFLLADMACPPLREGLRERKVLDGDPLPRAALQVWLLPRAGDGGVLPREQARRQALAVCADEIVRLLDEGERALRLGQAAQPGRSLRAGDIAVLVRSHGIGRAMRLELARRGVGSVELSQNSVFASAEAGELACLLAAVLAPRDPARVLAALATLMFGGSAAGIDDIAADESLLAAWMGEFAAALERWHGGGFAAMFWPLAERHGVVARLLAADQGARRLTNLRQLSELLQAAAATHPAPQAQAAWLAAQVAAPDGDEERQLRLDSDADLVQIVTVHRSKGLEYPVVFCPALWTAPQSDRGGPLGLVEYHRDGRACIDWRTAEDCAVAERQAIAEARAEDRFAEELRLFYVALTRAANRCYLVAGAWSNGRGNPAQCTSAARTPLAWLCEGAPPTLEDWLQRACSADALEQSWLQLAQDLGRPEALAVERMPEDRGRCRPAGDDRATPFRALAPPRLPQRRLIGSYTRLTAWRDSERAAPATEALAPDANARDHDLLAGADGRDLVPAMAATVATRDILNFPRGADAGTCLHAVLEHADFAGPASWPGAIARALDDHAGWLDAPGGSHSRPAIARMLQAWLGELAATTLPGGLRLDALDQRRCLRELEFHLPVGGLDAGSLQALLARHRLAGAPLRFDSLHGHLKGFIDLVFEHQGRWYVADWKSNHLGWRRQDYAPERVAAEVLAHDYALQALLYLFALDRLLRCRLAGYQPERQLGGAYYLFVRGVRPAWSGDGGEACAGCWHLPAPLAALRELGTLLDGEAEPRR